MRLRCTIAAVALMATMGLAQSAAQQPPGSSPVGGPIVTATRQNAFTIPFRIDPPASPAEKPVEALLNVSTDRGATWAVASRVKPEQGSFVFRAPHDGEYWFSIRTVDAQGVTRPSGPMQTQLQVTVDTVAPRLDLTVTRGPAGEIVARWQAVDPNLNLGSFKLEYQASSTAPWDRVAVETPPSAMKHTLSGEATWWADGAHGPILVRAEITDMAGNPAVTQAVVKPGPAAGTADNRVIANPRTPTLADPDGWRAGSGDATTEESGTRWPADRAVIDPLLSGHESGSRDLSVPSSLPEDAYSSSGAPAGFAPDVGPPAQFTHRPTPAPTLAGPTPATPTPTPARTVSQSRPAYGGGVLDFSILPAAVRPRMVNSTTFELEYEIDSVGPSGIGKVELWGTRDGGRTWSDYAVDTDKRSPIPVAVAGEGIYGFRILVQSGSGFGGRPPAEGDLPDIWIGVDKTKPVCRITGADVTQDGAALIVTWEASDDALDPRPITLLFAESPNSPWTPIASGLENTGSYRWRLDNRVPPRILLRLEVRDEAGNVGTYDLNESIVLDRNRPQGKIRGVRAIAQ
jgi:hypothetical protein